MNAAPMSAVGREARQAPTVEAAHALEVRRRDLERQQRDQLAGGLVQDPGTRVPAAEIRFGAPAHGQAPLHTCV